MISKFEDLDNLFVELDKALSEEVHFYVIGGAVLLYHGLKFGTKDVDIVVDSPKEFMTAEKALKKIGFATRLPAKEYNKFDLSQVLVRDDFRIDLFQKTVCKGFRLSDGMKARAQKVRALKYLAVSLCSITDLFMFKTFTEREGDIADCISLAQGDIDWDLLLDEILLQIKIVGNAVWITWIGERLDLLEEKGLFIPIMSDVNKLREKYFKECQEKLSSRPQSK